MEKCPLHLFSSILRTVYKCNKENLFSFCVNEWSAEDLLSMMEYYIHSRTLSKSFCITTYSHELWKQITDNEKVELLNRPTVITPKSRLCQSMRLKLPWCQICCLQVTIQKAQFPTVPAAALECLVMVWPEVRLSALGASLSTKGWEFAETGRLWWIIIHKWTC